ncbi:hypothetical protein COLO4_04237 [Corchorus olitorius]|uniref:Uncharacterized protein n=1 Tax=Corchorus olitorius TaxID=93759 RepID=A0A1R3KUT6_9ROSI|nr:hypothetical protein COLO4_04237 [Corchorus olitorius]
MAAEMASPVIKSGYGPRPPKTIVAAAITSRR